MTYILNAKTSQEANEMHDNLETYNSYVIFHNYHNYAPDKGGTETKGRIGGKIVEYIYVYSGGEIR